ncbi:MAG: YdiU family protein [Afipia sp.]|nr:YdiU family protein [Afipia sp.]
MPVSPAYRASIRHSTLGSEFYDAVSAAPFPKQILRYRNQRSAKTVGLDALTDEEWIAHFGRFQPLPDAIEKPLALRYHGHQFRVYNPDLGDGRGFLFAQLHDDTDRLLDLATKGSGQTPWSRSGDGRLTLKGGVREVLATTMLEALGVDTSKSFSLIETGEDLVRGDEPSPTRSSVLVRLSHSHIRIGSFQRFAFLRQPENIAKLLDYTIQTYMPRLWHDEPSARAVAFLEEVCRRVARVGAQWMVAGFVHGVLNTDNTNITGESFDYGPWRFVPTLEPNFTAAYFDETGLYAYGRQPDALFWNVTRLAECLLGIAEREPLEAALGVFAPALQDEFMHKMVWRLGLSSLGKESDSELVRAVWMFLAQSQMAFERFFFDWYGGRASESRAKASQSKDAYQIEAFAPLRERLFAYSPAPTAKLGHPYFKRPAPCTMLIGEVEALWAPIAEKDDWSVFHAKLEAINEMRDAFEQK